MRKLVLGAVFGLLTACGGGNKTNVMIVDSGGGSDTGTDVCNVLTQTGCNAGEKCTWVIDATMPQTLGHIGCAPAGDKASGAACTRNPPGATGYDDCVGGAYCFGPSGGGAGVCKLICDQNGGAPMCPANYGCGTYEGLFGPAGQTPAAGICDPTCDPLADNDMDGSGTVFTKTGSACPTGNGCYGLPDSTSPTLFTCVREVNLGLYHRSACTGGTGGNGCANSAGNPYLNGCSQGYTVFFQDDDIGSTQWDCFAYCKPGNAYMGNAGTQQPNGQAPHRCQAADALGDWSNGIPNTTGTGTGANGEHCMYSWIFEIDSNGNFVRSNTSDTVGICIAHPKYHFDSNGDGNLTGADNVWPPCTTLAFGSNVNMGFDAVYFGCVDTATSTANEGFPFANKGPRITDYLRMPYHRTLKAE